MRQWSGSVRSGVWSFGAGAGMGVMLALVALIVLQPTPDFGSTDTLGAWMDANLGYSVWLFGVVIVFYAANLNRLSQALDAPLTPEAERQIVELDQLIDVWTHLFIGIGVIWTAIGMRSALQAALGDTDAALGDTAGNVLQKLVDGGILLALTTTIVGGIGGYLMRLLKTIMVGAALHDYYELRSGKDIRDLLSAVSRIEARLRASGAQASALGQPGDAE